MSDVHAQARRVRPGDRLPERRMDVTQRLVDRYAEVSGDHNPLHVDPAFAATTAFGGPIAHGLLTLAVVSHALAAWDRGAWPDGGELEATFVGPVLVGQELVVSGEVVAVSAAPDGTAGTRAECRVECAASGRLAVVATAWVRLDQQEVEA
jgi:3-hydroxybutyryl-CoA dehydratase